MDRIEALISELTLEEKVSVLSGSTAWHTTAVPRLNLPRVKMTDGPIGARGDSVSCATSACFPSASCLSSSWDKENVKNRVNTPVIFLSALSDVEDRVSGLELGADDYIGKPFDSRELLLKIKKNILKKHSLDTLQLGVNTQFNLKKEQLHFNGNKINLSSNEIKILKLLINNSHQYLTRDLLNTELGLDFLSRSGDMQISRLRLKLKNECQ